MHGNVQSFIVHKASGCKDVLIVTSPCASLSICGKMRTRVRLWERCKNNQHKIAKKVLNTVLMLLCV